MIVYKKQKRAKLNSYLQFIGRGYEANDTISDFSSNSPNYKNLNEICTLFSNGMQGKQLEMIGNSLEQLYEFSDKKTILNNAIFRHFNTLQNIMFVFSNIEIFGVDLQILSIKIINRLISNSKDLVETIISFGIIPMISNALHVENDLLNIEIIICFTKLANHCDVCQNHVVGNIPLEQVHQYVRSKNPHFEEVTIDFLVSISKYPLDESVIEYCFGEFYYILNSTENDHFISTCIIGINYLVLQPSEIWPRLFACTSFDKIITLHIISEDPDVVIPLLDLVSNIYFKGEAVSGLQFLTIVQKLEYPKIRPIVSVTIKYIIRNKPELISKFINMGLLTTTSRVFIRSTFQAKSKMLNYLYVITEIGCPGDIYKLIESDILSIFVHMIENGFDKEVMKSIKAIDNCFREMTREKCCRRLRETEGSDVIFTLPRYNNQEIADFSNDFLIRNRDLIEGD